MRKLRRAADHEPRTRNAHVFPNAAEPVSIEHGIVRSVRTNTLTAQGKRQKTSPALHFQKILAPVDFSPASRNGLKHAVRFAEEFGAELTLLYVSEPSPTATFAAIPGAIAPPPIDFASAEKQLRGVATGVGNESVADIRWNIRVGVPAHEIVEAAKESDADLIVIATHGYTGWKHFCIGSTAERVVRAAPCPVLVVREKEHEF